jgi:hypothetical protein
LIDFQADRFFRKFPLGRLPGALYALRLLDEIDLAGAHSPTALFFLEERFHIGWRSTGRRLTKRNSKVR